MTIAVREAVLEDLPGIADLFNQYRQFYEQANNPQVALQFIEQRFERKESVLLVAENSSTELMGFCQLYPSFCSVMACPIYILYDLFVTPSARGLGAGRRLLQAARHRACVDGKARMDLTTAHTNHNAQALYESEGWQRDQQFWMYTRTVDPLSD
jgi:ribosomal protein S18 acetylase RimI-like enzyme